jgi:2-oxo-3-hexenedioate decarboxylase
MSTVALDLDAVAAEMQSAQDAVRQLRPFTDRWADFDLPAAYEVARRIHARRLAAGARSVGRKIGFTNANIWPQYGVYAPIWAHVYDTTVVMLEGAQASCPVAALAEPRIEPEIVFRFREAPIAGATPAQILAAVDWVAHGFEIVQSHFPAWKFRAPDTVADGSLHGRLFVGPPQPLAALGSDPLAALAAFTLALSCDGQPVDNGKGANVMGSPLAAIAHLMSVLAEQARGEDLRAGELVTTGTITAAWPVRAGQTWSTRTGRRRPSGTGDTVHALEGHVRVRFCGEQHALEVALDARERVLAVALEAQHQTGVVFEARMRPKPSGYSTRRPSMVFTSVAPSNFALFCSWAINAWLSPSRSSFTLSSGSRSNPAATRAASRDRPPSRRARAAARRHRGRRRSRTSGP